PVEVPKQFHKWLQLQCWLLPCEGFIISEQQGLQQTVDTNNRQRANHIQPEERHDVLFIDQHHDPFCRERSYKHCMTLYLFEIKCREENAQDGSVKQRA